jgi:hypothetical protein
MENKVKQRTFSDKIREELLSVKEQGYKTRVQKRVFIIALLGLGSIDPFDGGIGNIINGVQSGSFKTQFYQILYLAPFVAIIFDALSAEHGFSVRRMGKFLRIHSEDEIEKDWEKFVHKHRDNFFRQAEILFTLLTFLSSLYILFNIQNSLSLPEILWFAFLAVVYAIFIVLARARFKELEGIVQYTYWRKDADSFAGFINDYPEQTVVGVNLQEIRQKLLTRLAYIEKDEIFNVKKVDELLPDKNT